MPSTRAPHRLTFAERARRAQIVECAADAIAELGYASATMAEIARRADIAKSVISYHFTDKNELIQELVRTAVATSESFLEPRIAAAPGALGKIRAYLTGVADFMVAHRSLHLAVLEVAFNALGPDGHPVFASMPPDVHAEALEGILRQGQRSGELRNFDIAPMAGLLRSSVTHTMIMANRVNPDLDLAAYADELATTFEIATRADPAGGG